MLLGQLNFGIEMPNLFYCLIDKPSTIAAHIFGETLVALVLGEATSRRSLLNGSNRTLAGELWRDFDHRLVYENGDRIQIGRVAQQAETLPLKWQRTPASEWIMEFRHALWVE